jgi:hypothetical protein
MTLDVLKTLAGCLQKILKFWFHLLVTKQQKKKEINYKKSILVQERLAQRTRRRLHWLQAWTMQNTIPFEVPDSVQEMFVHARRGFFVRIFGSPRISISVPNIC